MSSLERIFARYTRGRLVMKLKDFLESKMTGKPVVEETKPQEDAVVHVDPLPAMQVFVNEEITDNGVKSFKEKFQNESKENLERRLKRMEGDRGRTKEAAVIAIQELLKEKANEPTK